jgi:prolyl oligopeptidase
MLTVALLAATALALPPQTKAVPTVDDYAGTKVTDEYRWLEPLEKDSPEVKAWTDAQLAHLRATLDPLRCREELRAKLAPLMQITSWSAPIIRGPSYFYAMREGGMNQPAIYARTGGANVGASLILDPNIMDPTGLTSIDWWSPSWQGSKFAYGTSKAGSEMSVLKVMRTDTKEHLKDEISGKVTFGGWNESGDGFVYSRLTDPNDPYSRVVCYHKLGEPVEKDPVLLRQTKPSEVPFGALTSEDRWVLLGMSRGWTENDLWAAKLDDVRNGRDARVPVAVGRGAQFSPVEVVGDRLYMTTTLGAPNTRLVMVDLNDPAEGSWKDIVPERKDAVMTQVDFGKDEIVVVWQKDAHDIVGTYKYDGKPAGDIPLPGLGSASVQCDRRHTEMFLSYASYNTPRTIYRCDIFWKPYKPEVWARPEVPAKLDDIEVTQIRATSKDGTQVPAFVVMKKGAKMDGSNPAVLYGYGGFDISLTPEFIPTIIPFLERGGIYVVANLRGGGEYGDAWHKAGMLQNKQNVFDDLYAVAEKLIVDKYTSAAHLAVMGGSNGGLLTAVAVTQRPELWSAAVSAVPLCDMLRYQNFLLARYWVPEYGSSEDAAAFKWLSAYSPYHNAKKGTKYPAVLFTAGENDSRVHPLHARKMAALLQATTASDPAAKPILLWVDRDAGHGAGKPLDKRVAEAVDMWSFLMWQTGACNEGAAAVAR